MQSDYLVKQKRNARPVRKRIEASLENNCYVLYVFLVLVVGATVALWLSTKSRSRLLPSPRPSVVVRGASRFLEIGGKAMCCYRGESLARSVLVASLPFLIGMSAIPLALAPIAPPLPQSYVFVSPNTRSSLTDGDAQRSFDSFEQKNAVAVADRIVCSLTQSVQIADALGVYSDSSEKSFIIESDLAADSSQYVASLLGRYAHQEFVLTFIRQQHGPDKLWVIDLDRPAGEVIKAIRALGLGSSTVRSDHGRTELLFVDFRSAVEGKLKALASRLHGSTSTEEGVGTLRGSEDRMRAAALFDADIQDREHHSAYRFSTYLWTQDWHDATSRTCSGWLPLGD